MPAYTLPHNPLRILLVNPTKYLGNLLIAGNLIQEFSRYCSTHNIEFRVVLDAAFKDLIKGALPEACLIYYPRKQIAQADNFQKIRLYLDCLHTIRNFGADIAFNIEEDSVAHRLTQFSKARFRLGCSTSRHGFGYHHVIPINFATRPTGKRHRWYSFQEMFKAVGLPETAVRYMHLQPAALSLAKQQQLTNAGLDLKQPLVVLHAGATKDYKKWPRAYFAELTALLIDKNLQVAFIGAGQDAVETAAVLALLTPATAKPVFNLCNQLSLPELADFFTHASVIVGNDSGPFHLAAAMGVAGTVIFGPTAVEIWEPLTSNTEVAKGTEPCSPECTKIHCIHQHRCLRSITPQMIFSRVMKILNNNELSG